MIQVRTKVSYREGEERFFGPGVVQLLELVDECGSLKEACLEMGMSYSKGRAILLRAETFLGFALIEKRRGGQSGGASVLTEAGRKAALGFRELEHDIQDYAERRFEELIAGSLEVDRE